jgi:hypothetical protein
VFRPPDEYLGEFIRTTTVETLDKQPLVGIPMPLVKAAGKKAVAEFEQVDPDVLILRLAPSKSQSSSPLKRFRVVAHRGTHWTSIPKPWLNDRGTQPGDVVEVFWTPDKTGLALRLTRHPRRNEGDPSAGRIHLS